MKWKWIIALLILIPLVYALEQSKFDFKYPPQINYSLIPTVNSSDFWDALDDPTDISLTSINNDCSSGEFYDGDGTGICINFNDSVKTLFAEEQVIYNATSIVTDVGTLDSGDLNSITQFADGDSYNVSEVSGVPGFIIYINFTGVLNFNTVALRGKYDGGAGHTLALEIYRTGVGWEEREEITDQFDWGVTTFPVFIGSNFIDGGTVQFRINHDENGIIAHDYFLDAVFIGQVPGLVSGGDLADLTGRDNACVLLPDVFCKDGSKNMTNNLIADEGVNTTFSYFCVGSNCYDDTYWINQSQGTFDYNQTITEIDPIFSANFTNMQDGCPAGNYSYDIFNNGTLKCRSDEQGAGAGMDYTNVAMTNQSNQFNRAQNFTIIRTAGQGLRILDDIGEAFYLIINAFGDALTANKILNIDVGDDNRLLTLVGNATLGDWFNQCVKSTCSPSFNDLTLGPSGDFTTSSGGIWSNTLLRIFGTQIGLTTDEDLLVLANNILTINGDLKVTGSHGNISADSISTDSNEKIAHDVVRHTIDATEEGDDYFYEAWTKATPEEIISLNAVIWLNGTDEVYDTSNYYTSNPNVFDIEVKITTDEDEELYVSDDSDKWLLGNVVTIFISYEV